MKKTSSQTQLKHDRDTMRKEYDFSGAVRGVTAARYAQGTNVVVIDPKVTDVFLILRWKETDTKSEIQT